ncbi:hypothetical protein ACHAWF_004603 [Thalassiosira exigua]
MNQMNVDTSLRLNRSKGAIPRRKEGRPAWAWAAAYGAVLLLLVPRCFLWQVQTPAPSSPRPRDPADATRADVPSLASPPPHETPTPPRPNVSRPAASSADKSFAALGLPWPHWTPCDPSIAFERRCRPEPTTCHKNVTVTSTHGIGNALITTYRQPAADVFAKGCAPRLVDDFKSFKLLFRLLDYFREPNGTLGTQDESCVLHAITQPGERLARVLEDFASDRGWDAAVPLVGVHVRTGWADELSRRSAAWDALGDCAEYRGSYGIDGVEAAGEAVLGLVDLVNRTKHAADSAFGAGKWRAFVASDAPAAKVYASTVLSNDGGGTAMYFEGKVGHNNDQNSRHRRGIHDEISMTSMADLMMLSTASIVVMLSSEFPEAAVRRSVCTVRKLKYKVRPYPRHRLWDIGTVLMKALGRRKPNEPSPWTPHLEEDEMKLLETMLPQGKNHPCLSDPHSKRSCLCLFKLGHAAI